MEEIETFFGKLREIHETVPNEQSLESLNGLSTAAYVKLLERKVCILEDIVNTTCARAELNCSTLSNDVNQLFVAKRVSIGTCKQTLSLLISPMLSMTVCVMYLNLSW